LYRFRALDMIRWIKEEYGDYFTIACSGYPTGHPEAPSYRADLLYLKSKVEAGADFIITQLFFDSEVYEKFLRDCREIGITVPIIPGILPIQSYGSIRRITEMSQLVIPDWIRSALEPIKNDDEAVRNFGIRHAVDLCRALFRSGSAPSVHLYTLNREASCR
uniref:Methylenetetrahydrofolate reductase [NAD(P)H] n=1 Tax=Gongylonema pulchrum TaxID=637853 RepID=A0A183DBV0_9BILA